MRTIIGATIASGAAASASTALQPDGPHLATHVQAMPTSPTRNPALPTNAELIELHNKAIVKHWSERDEALAREEREKKRHAKGYSFNQIKAIYDVLRANATKDKLNPVEKRLKQHREELLDVHPEWKFDREVDDIHNLTKAQEHKMRKEMPGQIEMERKLKKDFRTRFSTK